MLDDRVLGRKVRGRARGAAVDLPAIVLEVESGIRREQVHVGFPQGFDRADVLPVALEPIGDHLLPVAQHGRNDILAEVVGGLLVLLVLDQILAQLFPGEDINAHGRQRGLRVFGLFLEFIDRAVRLAVHDAEAGRLGQRHVQHRDGRVRAGLLVLLQHLVVVHLVDMVARKDQHIFGVVLVDKCDILVDRVRRTLVPLGGLALLVRRQDVHAAAQAVEVPGLARTDIGVEHMRLVLREHAHRINARIGAVGQREVDNAVLAPKRYRGLGDVLRQHIQAAALSTCEQHGHAFFFPIH